MIYRDTDKMSLLLMQDRRTIQIVNRFGIPMGVGDKSIQTVCKEHGIHTPTFLAIVNNGRAELQTTDIDLPTLQTYLRNAHTYFLEFLLPRLRRQLIEAINPTTEDNRVPLLILKYYDDYVQEIRMHIQHENEGRMENHATDDRHITEKLHELVSLIVKYYPAHPSYPFANELMTTVLMGIYQTEEELKTHCAIEDDILRPAVEREQKAQKQNAAALKDNKNQRTKTKDGAADGLSEREKEVLTLVVQGLINKEIADKLHLSLHTVIAHRKNIAHKLNIHSTAGLTIYAIVNHLIEVDGNI